MNDKERKVTPIITLDMVLDEIDCANMRGEKICIVYEGIEIHSDSLTKELYKELKAAEIRRLNKEIKELIPIWKKAGKEIIPEGKQEEWQNYIDNFFSGKVGFEEYNSYLYKDFDRAIAILRSLKNGSITIQDAAFRLNYYLENDNKHIVNLILRFSENSEELKEELNTLKTQKRSRF